MRNPQWPPAFNFPAQNSVFGVTTKYITIPADSNLRRTACHAAGSQRGTRNRQQKIVMRNLRNSRKRNSVSNRLMLLAGRLPATITRKTISRWKMTKIFIRFLIFSSHGVYILIKFAFDNKADSMKQISREEAEKFFQNVDPRDSRVERMGKELHVSFVLADATSLVVIYDTAKHEESFFVEPPSTLPPSSPDKQI